MHFKVNLKYEQSYANNIHKLHHFMNISFHQYIPVRVYNESPINHSIKTNCGQNIQLLKVITSHSSTTKQPLPLHADLFHQQNKSLYVTFISITSTSKNHTICLN